jgi:hypothetical protein
MAQRLCHCKTSSSASPSAVFPKVFLSLLWSFQTFLLRSNPAVCVCVCVCVWLCSVVCVWLCVCVCLCAILSTKLNSKKVCMCCGTRGAHAWRSCDTRGRKVGGEVGRETKRRRDREVATYYLVLGCLKVAKKRRGRRQQAGLLSSPAIRLIVTCNKTYRHLQRSLIVTCSARMPRVWARRLSWGASRLSSSRLSSSRLSSSRLSSSRLSSSRLSSSRLSSSRL